MWGHVLAGPYAPGLGPDSVVEVVEECGEGGGVTEANLGPDAR